MLILIAGHPGDPGDWFLGDRVQNVMNDFAAGHNGIAPVVVVPDALGSTLANPDCLDSSLGNVDTYLSKDVPDGIKKQLRVDPGHDQWVIGGFSYGGICSLQMATNHPGRLPELRRHLRARGRDAGPRPRQQTIDKIFGGDEAKFKAINPKDIMAAKRFEDTAGWFIAGSEDSDTNPGQQKLNKVAQARGDGHPVLGEPGHRARLDNGRERHRPHDAVDGHADGPDQLTHSPIGDPPAPPNRPAAQRATNFGRVERQACRPTVSSPHGVAIPVDPLTADPPIQNREQRLK